MCGGVADFDGIGRDAAPDLNLRGSVRCRPHTSHNHLSEAVTEPDEPQV
jgi:hypothetical protein